MNQLQAALAYALFAMLISGVMLKSIGIDQDWALAIGLIAGVLRYIGPPTKIEWD